MTELKQEINTKQRSERIIEELQTEVEARKSAEAVLRESEERLGAVFEQLPVAVGVTDMNGDWVRRNSLMDEYVPAAVPSKLPDRAVRWHSWDESGSEIPPHNWPGARALRGETVSPGLDMRYTADDGRHLWMRVSTAPFRSSGGEMLGARGGGRGHNRTQAHGGSPSRVGRKLPHVVRIDRRGFLHDRGAVR